MGRLGVWELLIIFGVLLLLFGATKLPQLGSSLGSAIRNFKKGFTDDSATAAGGAAPTGTDTSEKAGAKPG